jgi:ComF family protein
MKILSAISGLLFPRKCHFCRKLLSKNETDLCHDCRCDAPEFIRAKRTFPLIAQWTAVWYYKDKVRSSILRFKFGNARGYADFYGRALAMKLEDMPAVKACDYITWVPVSPLRRFFRGYDQAELLAVALGKELGLPPVKALKKVRHNRPQSNIHNAASRRANVMNAYWPENRDLFAGKQVLLVDDVLTTGATAAECAKMLRFGGAREIYFAAVAAASHDKNK